MFYRTSPGLSWIQFMSRSSPSSPTQAVESPPCFWELLSSPTQFSSKFTAFLLVYMLFAV